MERHLWSFVSTRMSFLLSLSQRLVSITETKWSRYEFRKEGSLDFLLEMLELGDVRLFSHYSLLILFLLYSFIVYPDDALNVPSFCG